MIDRPLGATSRTFLILAALLAAPCTTFAQVKPGDAPAALPDDSVTQMPLSDGQIEKLIATQHDLTDATAKLSDNADKPDPKLQARLDAVVKKHGFSDYGEYDKVATNVGLVLSGFDPQTKAYVGPDAVLKKQIADIQADKEMPPLDKKKTINDLQESLKSVTPVRYPDNIKIVSKYYDKLNEALQQD